MPSEAGDDQNGIVPAILAEPTVPSEGIEEGIPEPAELPADTEQLPASNRTDPEAPEEGFIGYTEIEDRPIADLTTDIECNRGDLPVDHAAAKFAQGPTPIAGNYATRAWPGVLYEWEAPGLYHGPLYFEEENLERYGYTYRRNYFLQPLISGGRFVATAAALPYMLTLHPPCEPVYTLGYYRPGSCVPFQARLMELNAKAAAVQGAAVTGLIFAIP